eukprot:CAMPEP_0201532492 /NCGR_PEP_ID=MMETSP0161_2-20130828/50524_1 /ASSEMBLY_ACC=CAM_ASM_000251 /TAXON_ID=180227 /ORGANISM="Neoparamoeba aestuarina, Strain SoJaBio B1-5/56/2" /LENGTH=152 /DNA_ID=CAMNT_0047935937 /DNA_START=47 /DNA_END=505 /DNA_ORIENTATION=-
MITRSIGTKFAREYYRRYLVDPASLSSLYAESAVLCHTSAGERQGGDVLGTTTITRIEDLRHEQHWKKVVILHVDTMPCGASSVTILIGGYLVGSTETMCFVHNVILKHSGVANNYFIENDSMYIHAEQGCVDSEQFESHLSFMTMDTEASF